MDYTRDLSKYSDEDRGVYQKLFNETRELFTEKTEKTTIIHSMIIDRFVSTYIDLLGLDEVKTVSDKKYKTVQDKFQSWAKTVVDTLNSSALESELKRNFFVSVKEILVEEIPDDKLRKRIFKRVLNEAVNKR